MNSMLLVTIGTAFLWSKLLLSSIDTSTARLMVRYIDLRILISSVGLTRIEKRREYNRKTDKPQNKLWRIANKAACIDSRPVVTGYIIHWFRPAQTRNY